MNVFGDDIIGHFGQKTSYEYLFDSEWGYRVTAAWISRPISVSEVRGGVKITKDELLARTSDTAAHIKKGEDQLLPTTRHLRPRTAIWLTVGISNFLLWTVINMLYLCNKLVILNQGKGKGKGKK